MQRAAQMHRCGPKHVDLSFRAVQVELIFFTGNDNGRPLWKFAIFLAQTKYEVETWSRTERGGCTLITVSLESRPLVPLKVGVAKQKVDGTAKKWRRERARNQHPLLPMSSGGSIGSWSTQSMH